MQYCHHRIDVQSDHRSGFLEVKIRSLVLLALWLLPLLAHAGFNDGWSFRKKIVLNTSASGAATKEPVAELPVLIRLHTGNFVFTDAKEDGGDLRFFAADEKTPLKYHIEQWDAVSELALIWVHVPRVAPASTAEFIWMYFGNPKANHEDDAKGTYDAAMAAVVHFNGNAAPVDATGHIAALASSGLTPLAQGPIDGAATFAPASRVSLGASPALKIDPQAGVTFSAWVRVPAAQSQAALYTMQDGANPITVGINGLKPFVRMGSVQVPASTDITAQAWHHIAATADKSRLTLYVDGKPAGEAAIALAAISGEAAIGGGFSGDMDEVQISSVARSADWIKASWASQGADANLVSYGQDEQSGGGHSYFRILLGAVTLDGWVVIGILMVMMLVSFAVMVGKALFVTRTDNANRTFLQHFQANLDAMLDPKKLGRPDKTLQSSSLFRLHYIGLQEIGHRFDKYEGEGKPRQLTPQALGAIKSSLDAGMVREQARLNNQMVLLTIAISGGPFLGLLGTVVGVMITFAAIAAAGDVNVNSIAPGIAAALVATVAGLGVAIPALFGYNYLASRIKNLSNDMTVFADELINRLAERYAP
jgi:biopolymer transport protein ExbB